MMVAMNPQTWDADVAEISPGGYLFYDSTRSVPASRFRPDITVIGVPLTEISNSAYTEPRQRQLFKNIIYVGALSVLLDGKLRCLKSLCRAVQGQGRCCSNPTCAPCIWGATTFARICRRPGHPRASGRPGR